MKKVFVSGTYDILHAGHIQFFKDARALGDHLTVCVASDEVVRITKHRKPAVSEDNKLVVIRELSCVDNVLISSDSHPVFDFKKHILRERPDILAVTDDDKNISPKKTFCAQHKIDLVVLKKRPGAQKQISTTLIRAAIKNVEKVPLRVDFAGGWLDVPKFARPGSFIVNCTITPKVSLSDWPYHKGAGLGGSAAHAILQVRSGILSEFVMGVGWQDPAVIAETGLCVWRSGPLPVLEAKFNPQWLSGRLLIVWQGKDHTASEHVKAKRDFEQIVAAGKTAADAARAGNIEMLSHAVRQSYSVQLSEGMAPLPDFAGALAKKYLGAGHGGYALYLFEQKKNRDATAKTHPNSKIIEPYIRQGAELLET
ncbi:MAG: adenylyltransferase/cytidyltransferase family protein [Verrucomicrobiota bacterium]|jgi:cytidyltransferase-like protein